MKKLGLLFTALLIGLVTVSAAEKTSEKLVNNLEINTRYNYTQPIRFVERGVEFLIFPDGSFDFNTHTQSPYYSGNLYYRTSTITRRSSVNRTFGAPRTTVINRVQYSQPRNTGVLIEHDTDGKVRRIGNVFINYDRTGKIKRAGSVYMSYNRINGLLSQVGGLYIHYNNWGQVINTSGFINHTNNTTFGYNSPQNGTVYDTNNWYDSDEDFYYYKQNGKTPSKK
ncbi:hypothetical protein GCM10022271_23360 [Corallibacter vietnamensis]|uniref:Uncharacterized protein n=1 Tax=Corallibacter vietnamensis TaxID=904130 RepID=A0ABP7HD18_9FLAO